MEMHDVIVVGIPMIAIVAGILFNRSDARDLRAEMAALRAEVRGEIGSLRSELHAGFARIDADLRRSFR
jgi:hypothetical protein